jgi:ABC-2 type transport system ATP-binding protein
VTYQDLAEYIAAAHAAGVPADQIATTLKESGWDTDHLVRAFLSLCDTGAAEKPVIVVENVEKSFGKTKALDGVSVCVAPGSITALLGPNGAGKTTLVRILTTLMKADTGTATVAGLDLVTRAQDIRAVIGLAGQYVAVDERLTGRENLEMVARLYHLSSQDAKARAIELLERFALTDAGNRILKTYSGGMRRRLDLAASLVNRPQVLFLDEPTTGLDIQSRQALWTILRELQSDGTTILLTTQYLEEADQLADQIIVIDRGQVIAQGTPAELKSRLGGDKIQIRLSDHQQKDTAVRALEGAGVHVTEISVHQPTLDEVFLHLTNHEHL